MKNTEFKSNPATNTENIISGENYRISILTPSLVRLEYNSNGGFIDNATQIVVNRDFPKVNFVLKDYADHLDISTEYMDIYYNKKNFSSNGLSIKVKGTNIVYNNHWHYGMEDVSLKGTSRTLDNVNGSTPLDIGIISRLGYSVLDDSKSLLVNEDFVSPRIDTGIDIYVFCYGHRYLEALKDFYYLCGSTPLLPRFALGNWWSRYYRYSEETYLSLMDSFANEEIPFSVAVIDMDWHLVNIPEKYGSGWTGYTWNKELFKNPKGFLDKLHQRGMKVTLNVHPAEGVRAYEDAYNVFASYMEKDIEKEEPVEFDCTDPKFMEGYFKYVHHPLENEGVDFWWIDWQQGSGSKIDGLDPLWILNHYHFLDNGKDNNRPLTFSRYAGPGSHRYPVGFSGDTHITWDSLDFQPYFTANASNIGYGWWSHDIGGHMLGARDNELELRWYQFGVFSPIMRLHSSCNDFSGKEPWNFPLEIHQIMNQFLRLRHKLIPYLYTMNYLAYKGRPLTLPMYYEYPEAWDAYEVGNQYLFGTELIVAPVTTPNIKGINMAKVKVWLPEGNFFDIFTNVVYDGDRFVDMYRDYSSIPVLAKAGAILPTTNHIFGNDFLNNPSDLTINIYPGADNSFDLYEDDNSTSNYKKGECVITHMEYSQDNGFFKISKPAGSLNLIPKQRNITLKFFCINEALPTVQIGNTQLQNFEYNSDTHILTIEIPNWDYSFDISVDFKTPLEITQAPIASKIYEILSRAEIDYNQKEVLYRGFKEHRSTAYILSQLNSLEIDNDTRGAIIEILLAKLD